MARRQSASEAAGDPVTDPEARSAVARRRPSVFDDPLVRRLSIVLALVVIVFLSTVAAALYLGILGSDIPKTGMQRDLQAYEAQVDAGSADSAIWGAYVSTLIEAGQLRKAQQIIDRGRGTVDDQRGADLTLAQARVYFARKDYEAAITECTIGMEALDTYHEQQKNTEGTPEQKNAPISPNRWELQYVRGLSYLELGQHAQAIDDFTAYLDKVPNAADVLVHRGDALRESGDARGAEADYRRALVFLGDYQAAIDGLKKLGVE